MFYFLDMQYIHNFPEKYQGWAFVASVKEVQSNTVSYKY